LVLLTIIFVLLGLVVGSFLNVCIDRLPRGQSIISPPSHCPSCDKKLSILDLVPIFSYLFLRGKCRYCKAPIPFRLPLVEGLTALAFGLLFWKFGLGLELAALLVYFCILTLIFFIDLEQMLVLNIVTYPAMAIALVFSFFRPDVRTFSIFWPGIGVESAVLGGISGFALMALIIIVARIIYGQEALGWGDAKLAALIGLMTGFPLVFAALLMSWILGGVVAIALVALKLKSRKDIIPTATFMAITTMVTLLWGQAIYQWYSF
jgi:leader peptidase (prepilin peptidase) / N-methyltransferase